MGKHSKQKLTELEKYSKKELAELIQRHEISSTTIEELQFLSQSYEEFIYKFDLLVARYNLHLIEDKDVQEILECVARIEEIYDSLPDLVNILRSNIGRKIENVRCSFLGLSEEVANYILGKY